MAPWWSRFLPTILLLTFVPLSASGMEQPRPADLIRTKADEVRRIEQATRFADEVFEILLQVEESSTLKRHLRISSWPVDCSTGYSYG